MPIKGPTHKNTKTNSKLIFVSKYPINWILIIVIKNPMQLTKVITDPLISCGAFCAIKVENKGESAMTTIDQKQIKKQNAVTDTVFKK